MIRALFARLTGGPKRGQALFGLAVAEARRPTGSSKAKCPTRSMDDSRVLATIVALITVRLERDGEDGRQATVALTERLVETLDAEIREMGLGDPTLGKQVRKLVGAVAGRVERWRALVGIGRALGGRSASEASISTNRPVPIAVAHSEWQLERTCGNEARRIQPATTFAEGKMR